MLDFSRSRLPPFAHQIEDTDTVIRSPYLLIASDMRTGKSKIVIDAAQFMFEAGVIDKVIVVAPSPVKDVWSDPDIGELHKHLWDGLPARVSTYHERVQTWQQFTTIGKPKLEWLITNYEFIRSKNRLTQLLPYCTPKTLLVCDESSFVKNWKSQQTKSCMQLRKKCGRIIELNGTPISHSPLDLFSQGNLLHPSILGCTDKYGNPHITYYKARYAIQEPVFDHKGEPLLDPYGRGIETITGWTNLDDIQRRFAPYVIRRLQADCLDLPPKLDPVMLTATLTPDTWKIYKEMRDDMVVWLKSGNVATSRQATVKVLRLAQITSGFLGGIEDANIEEYDDGFREFRDDPEGLYFAGSATATDEQSIDDIERRDDGLDRTPTSTTKAAKRRTPTIEEIGREKLDVVLWFLGQRLIQYPNLHIVVWCRFRPELFRLLDAVKETYPQFEIASIVGGQKKDDRRRAMQLLHPDTASKNPTFIGGTYGTGSFGLNFTAANVSFNCSFDYSLGKFKQSGDRIYGPGMIGPAAYFELVATGPKGQKTIDHAIVVARRNADNIATWTTAAWITALTAE